ncbi:Gfo/Idh/MocA family oxidoreductase [Marinifilum fragile]|uniref:Gfo/Idh/MocA family protein n=1 Tax=Marinifilum fragile TaxID=570161 RepID=UPI002AAAEE68|nr:Gfo/Idh/MocA family oxidoreductase [Marinifilum fragile]
METKRKIKFGIVGLGHIGKRHLEMIRCNRDAEIVACCDLLPLEELELFIPGIPFYRDYGKMLRQHKEMDVLNICVPNGLHAEITIEALNMGFHVVCEKPMALSKSEAEKMLYKSLEVSRHIFVVKQNRYSPPAMWLKEIINQEQLGKIHMVQMSCFWNRDERYYQPNSWRGTQHEDGGTLFTQFSHFIDIMYWLFGDIKNVKGIFKDFKHEELTDFEDSGVVSFEFVNGGIGCLNYSTAVYNKNLESSVIIIGDKGTVKVAGQYMNEVVYCDIESYEMPELKPSNPPIDYGAYKGSAQNHHYVIANVVNKLQNKAVIATNALEGLKVVDIIERIYQLRDLTSIKRKNGWVKQFNAEEIKRKIS